MPLPPCTKNAKHEFQHNDTNLCSNAICKACFYNPNGNNNFLNLIATYEHVINFSLRNTEIQLQPDTITESVCARAPGRDTGPRMIGVTNQYHHLQFRNSYSVVLRYTVDCFNYPCVSKMCMRQYPQCASSNEYNRQWNM